MRLHKRHIAGLERAASRQGLAEWGDVGIGLITMQQLEAAGLIKYTVEALHGGTVRCYRITDAGREALKEAGSCG